ncbi:Sulfhydryl oxidase [Mycena venus]|uniref:Sulfhydryl oxidase n=1 Tax=Mycena venus TaxID=2733690 RepID=A0A8H6YDE1_9AGAR|nr:Sulfhydryl oxidase [Mycena venus]
MDHLGDKPSLLACNLVCRSWAPRSKCLLLDLMVCHPVPLVAHGGFGAIACAVPDPFQGNGGTIYGAKDGIYRGIKDGSRLRLLSIHDVSQIKILPGLNLVLCLAGGTFMTMSLSALNSGNCQDSAITRISKHVFCFTVYRSTVTGESHRVCALKTSSLSGTLKVYNVSNNNQVSTLVPALELYIPLETYSVRFLSQTRLVAAIKKGFAVQGGFEMVDLITAETQSLLDPDDPSPLDLAHKKVKPRTVFRVDTVFLVCYDKLAFYIDCRGIRPLNKVVLRWTQPVHAFALHQPYILAFCERCMEVWNIETGEMAQKIQGPYHLLNTPESGEKVLGLSLLSGEITEIVFRAHASLNS